MDSLDVLVCMRTCNSTTVFCCKCRRAHRSECLKCTAQAKHLAESDAAPSMHARQAAPSAQHMDRSGRRDGRCQGSGQKAHVAGPIAVRCRRSVRCLWRSGGRSTCSWRRTCGRRQWLPLAHTPGALNGSSCSSIAAAEAASAAEVAASLVHLSFWRAC